MMDGYLPGHMLEMMDSWLIAIDCSGLIVKHWLKNIYFSLLRSFIGFGTLKDDRVFTDALNKKKSKQPETSVGRKHTRSTETARS